MKRSSHRSKPTLPRTLDTQEPDRSSCCDTCGKPIAGFESTSVGDSDGHYQTLCNRCCNEQFARSQGLDFTHIDFEPLVLKDGTGVTHRFFFEVRLLGDRVLINALELKEGRPGGYEFQVLGPSGRDLFELMSEMVTRIRRTLSRQDLKEDDEFGLRVAESLVRGRFAWDDSIDGRRPLLVIDGKELTWDELGEILSSYEGWQFRLEIKDRSEEV